MPATSTPLLSLGVDHNPTHIQQQSNGTSSSSEMPPPDIPAAPEDVKSKRNYDLNEISKAVHATDDESFNKSSFALKRTRSMGLLDTYIVRPATDLTGTINDYPHLSVADGSVSSNGNGTNNNNHNNNNNNNTNNNNLNSNISTSSIPPAPNTFINTAQQIPSSASSASSVSSSSTFSGVTSPASPNSVVSNYSSASAPQNATTNNITYSNLVPAATSSNHPDQHVATQQPSGSSSSPSPPLSHDGTPDLTAVHDDSVLAYEPQCHVDYLSHDWKESDISNCWRNIVSRRRDVANSARLENASWRTWTKAKYNLRTVSPESVNWLKDCDITWLYGPLYNQPMNIHYTDPRLEDGDDKAETQPDESNRVNSITTAPATAPSTAVVVPGTSPANTSNNRASASVSASTNTTTTANTIQSPVHKPILKKRTVSDKLFARQNSGHHTPTISTFNSQHSGNSSDETINTDVYHNNNSSSKDDLHQHSHTNRNTLDIDDDPMNDDGISTYLRHHNYRHRPHTGHSDEKISRQINLQYRHVPGHLINSRNNSSAKIATPGSFFTGSSASEHSKGILSAPSSAPQGPTNPPGDASASPVSLLEASAKSSVTSFRPLERHIHFNDRVEQCVAVNTYDSSSEDEEEEDVNSYNRNRRFRREWRTRESRNSESDSDNGMYGAEDNDSGSSDSESDEDEPGLFLSLRSSSTTSLHRIDRFASMSPKHNYQTIAPLPATTLRASYDEQESEERQVIEANSVAYAMSHNTQPRTHIYSVYDYNSVYQAPAVQASSTSTGPHQSSSTPEMGQVNSINPTSTAASTTDPLKIAGPSNILQNKFNSSIELGRSSSTTASSIVAGGDSDTDDDDTILALPSHLTVQMPVGDGPLVPTASSTGSSYDLGGLRPAGSMASMGSQGNLKSVVQSKAQVSTERRPPPSRAKIGGGFQMGGSDSEDESDEDEPMGIGQAAPKKPASAFSFGGDDSDSDSEDVDMIGVPSDVSALPPRTMLLQSKPTSSLNRSPSSSTNIATGFAYGSSSSNSAASSLRSSSFLGRSSSTNLASMMNSPAAPVSTDGDEDSSSPKGFMNLLPSGWKRS